MPTASRVLSLAALTVIVLTVRVSAETGAWSTLAPAPTKRTEVAAAVLAGKIYVVGGFAEPGLSNIARLAVSDAVEVYDPAGNTWTSVAPLPARLHHAGAAALGTHLYVVGGFTTGFLSLWNPVKTAYRYDPAADRWTELPPMPTARGALGLAAANGKLYAVGGIGENGNSGALEVYDPETNRWTSVAPLPTPRDHLAVAAVAGRLYAIGGRLNGSYSRNLGVNEAYDPATDRWTTAAPLPTPRSGIAAGVIGETIYVVGGEAPEGTFQTTEAYVAATNQWRAAAPMPTARHGLGAAVVGGRMYVIAGGPTPGGSFSNVNERYDPGPAISARSMSQDAAAKPVGAVMALLATFQDAGVLPPESSQEAKDLIRALIQFQAAFMKSAHPAIHRLLEQALTSKLGEGGGEALRRLQSDGWTSRSLEAVVEHVTRTPVWNHADVVGEFRAYNIGRREFEVMARVFIEARAALKGDGRDLHAVYKKWRRDMPGANL